VNPRGGGGSKWVIGCLVVLFVILACCGGTIGLAYYGLRRSATDVIQQQATALGTGNIAFACSFNSASLNVNTPCMQYVQWLNAYAPWFAGATIHVDRTSITPDQNRGFRYTVDVTATGPRGTGHLTFSLVSVGGHTFIDAIVPPR
jgi:hypothetical protein